MMEDRRDELVSMYAELASITAKACAARNGCLNDGKRGMCCEEEICLMVRSRAADWGVELDGDPPYNSDGPCRVPPHLRPICSVHQCEIASIGVFRNLSEEDQRRYWGLREETDLIEFEMSRTKDDAVPGIEADVPEYDLPSEIGVEGHHVVRSHPGPRWKSAEARRMNGAPMLDHTNQFAEIVRDIVSHFGDDAPIRIASKFSDVLRSNLPVASTCVLQRGCLSEMTVEWGDAPISCCGWRLSVDVSGTAYRDIVIFDLYVSSTGYPCILRPGGVRNEMYDDEPPSDADSDVVWCVGDEEILCHSDDALELALDGIRTSGMLSMLGGRLGFDPKHMCWNLGHIAVSPGYRRVPSNSKAILVTLYHDIRHPGDALESYRVIGGGETMPDDPMVLMMDTLDSEVGVGAYWIQDVRVFILEGGV